MVAAAQNKVRNAGSPCSRPTRCNCHLPTVRRRRRDSGLRASQPGEPRIRAWQKWCACCGQVVCCWCLSSTTPRGPLGTFARVVDEPRVPPVVWAGLLSGDGEAYEYLVGSRCVRSLQQNGSTVQSCSPRGRSRGKSVRCRSPGESSRCTRAVKPAGSGRSQAQADRAGGVMGCSTVRHGVFGWRE